MAIQEHPRGLSGWAARHRRLWAAALLLYAAIGLGDMGMHLRDGVRSGLAWSAPANLTVAFSAGLFWPADLVARALLSR